MLIEYESLKGKKYCYTIPSLLYKPFSLTYTARSKLRAVSELLGAVDGLI